MNAHYAYSDEELIYLIRSKQDEAMKILHLKYESDIRLLVKRRLVVREPSPHEDAMQKAREQMVHALNHYRDDRESGYRHYMTVVIDRGIKTANRDNYRQYIPKTSTIKESNLSIKEDEEVYLCDILPDPSPHTNPQFEFYYQLYERRYIQYLHTLDPQQKEIYMRYLAKQSYQHIAQSVGISVKKVDYELGKIRRNIRALFD